MKKIVILLVYFVIFNSVNSMQKANQTTDKNWKRKNILRLMKSDIKSAAKIINESDLVPVLSYLQIQDKGGNKYYLLEKETIDTMNKSVTEGLYKDLILINNDGIVVYTLSNKAIFSKNVNDLPKNSPYFWCFVNNKKETGNSILNNKGFLYLSTTLIRKNYVTGILILKIRENNKKLLKYSKSNHYSSH